MTNQQYAAYVKARAQGRNPDDGAVGDGTTMKALVEAVTVLQKKVLKQDEQITQLRADVDRRQAMEGEPS